MVAVHGLGGVGKGTLAARLAELHAHRFPWTGLRADGSARVSGTCARNSAFPTGPSISVRHTRIDLALLVDQCLQPEP